MTAPFTQTKTEERTYCCSTSVLKKLMEKVLCGYITQTTVQINGRKVEIVEIKRNGDVTIAMD